MILSTWQFRRQVVLRALATMPMTVDEFIATRDLFVNSWAPVFSELKSQWLIEPTGERRPTRRLRLADVMTTTDLGKVFIE